ncbi:hypothetical protein [Symmachiella dynata]|uniref:hypothetical protein n=1 Tax=Symmachiella dynata TaxID=2527995 RepID=UPI0030EBFAA8
MSIEGLACSIMRKNFVIRLTTLSITLMLVLGLTQSAFSQAAPAADDSPEVRLTLEANSRLGSFSYVPEQWGEFFLRLENDGDTPKELLCTSYFDDASTLQYGRKIWLPAHSKLVLSHPALFPAADTFSGKRANVTSLLFDQSQGKEVLLKNRAGLLEHKQALSITPDGRNTGIIAGWDSAGDVPKEVVDLVIANRVYQGLNNRVTFLAGQFLPAEENGLDHLDHLVIANDRLVDDLAALTAVRRWLHSGGRLWIMLDRTGPELLERLFGDEFQGSVVDQVGLTSVRVDDPPSLQVPEGIVGQTFEYDEPVQMARVDIPGMTVWNTVNEWPAALTGTYGEGRVLITTLGPRGWMKVAPPPPPFKPTKTMKTPPPDLAEKVAEYAPHGPMEDIAPFIFAKRDNEPLPPEELEVFAKEFVSYKVPSATLIIGSMCGFLILLAAAGGGLWKMGRLEHFGWCGSLLAIIFAMLFFGVGMSNRHGTSETIADVQLVQAIAGTDDVLSHGAIVVYRPEGGDDQIQTSQGGELIPNLTGESGETSRMVTTDLGTYYWDGLTQPTGLATYQFVASSEDADRLEAQATLDGQGIVGKSSGKMSSGSDVMVATRRGRISAQMTEGGNFTARADDVLEPDQFLNATLLNDVQDRRRRILQQLFSDQRWQSSLDQPHLLVWVNDWEHGFEFGENLQQQGDTLVIAPLQFSRPPAGTDIVIPSPLLDYVSTRPPDGSSPAGFWDDGRQEWQERSSLSTTWLSVQVPPAFLPLAAKKAQIEIGVSGLMGQIEILGVKGEEVVSLQTVTDPVGTVVIDIDDPEALTISENGELILGLSAGVPEDAAAADANFNADTPANSWKVHSLSLRLWGTTLDSTNEED